MRNAAKLLVIPLIWIVRLYQAGLSPYLGGNCRFYPSCSNYAIEAMNNHGLKGVFMAIKRISRCHPFSKGGYDPVRK